MGRRGEGRGGGEISGEGRRRVCQGGLYRDPFFHIVIFGLKIFTFIKIIMFQYIYLLLFLYDPSMTDYGFRPLMGLNRGPIGSPPPIPPIPPIPTPVLPIINNFG